MRVTGGALAPARLRRLTMQNVAGSGCGVTMHDG